MIGQINIYNKIHRHSVPHRRKHTINQIKNNLKNPYDIAANRSSKPFKIAKKIKQIQDLGHLNDHFFVKSTIIKK